MNKTLRALAIAGSFVLATGATTGVLAQDDASATGGSTGILSAEELAESILAEVLGGIALPTSGGLEIDVPAAAPTEGSNSSGGGDINVGGSSGGEINVGGSGGGGITIGSGMGG